jgi:type II secretory pathway component PulF
VVSALFYPAILFALSGLAIAVLMVAVVPKFTVMFEDMGTQLPPLTRGLIGFADFVSSFWWIILIMIVVLSIAFSRFIQLENGRLIFDRIKIRLPLIGKVFNSFAIIRFTQTMATLMENGVTLLPALRVVKDTIGNKVYSNAVSSAEQEIERGSTLAQELKRNKVFPPVVMHMISVGEESGSPQQMMSKLSEYYDLETKKNLERLTSLVGPLVILFMGVIIGLIAFAIIDPILKMSASIG